MTNPIHERHAWTTRGGWKEGKLQCHLSLRCRLWHWQCNYRPAPTILPHGVISYEMRLLSAIYGSPEGGRVLTCFRDVIRHVRLRQRHTQDIFPILFQSVLLLHGSKVSPGVERRSEARGFTRTYMHSLPGAPLLSVLSSLPSPPPLSSPLSSAARIKLAVSVSPRLPRAGGREDKRLQPPPRYLTNARPNDAWQLASGTHSDDAMEL